jgi:uncharacterized protein YggE
VLDRRRCVLLLLAPLFACAAPARAQAPVPPEPRVPTDAREPAAGRVIRVSGDGRVLVSPDVAVVHAGVEATGKTLAPTVADASARMRRVLAALSELGIAEKDVATARHDVQVERPWVDGRPRDITGYTVVDEVRITVRDLAKLGAVLDRVVAAGSNTLRGLTFERADPAPEREKALAQAVAAARGKARAIAEAAGVTLGAVVAVEEATQGPVIPFAVARKAELQAADGVPVTPGELEIQASVVATFGIR